MKVRCVNIKLDEIPTDRASDGWVTIGQEYVVLGIYGRGEEIKFRILGDDGTTPALQPAERFTVTLSNIPTDWVFRLYSSKEWEITPAAWSSNGFWVAYFDGEVSARASFISIATALGARVAQ